MNKNVYIAKALCLLCPGQCAPSIKQFEHLPHKRWMPSHWVLAVDSFSFSFSFSSRWHRSARKGPYALRPVSQQSPQGCPRNSANICLVEHRSFSTLEGGMSAASFLHSSFLQAVNAVMLWLVRVEKVPQASEHLCPAKLQTRCDICCACQSASGRQGNGRLRSLLHHISTRENAGRRRNRAMSM